MAAGASYRVFRQEFAARLSVIRPEEYLQAAAEVLFLGIVVSHAITLSTNRQKFDDNPLKDTFGYNNLCVAWDYPPANFVAAPIYALYVYLNLRYVVLDSLRARLSAKDARRRQVTYVTNVGFGFAVVAGAALFTVTPEVSVTGHTLLFGVLLVTRLGVLLGNYYESSERVNPASWAYLAICSLLTLLLVVLGSINLANGEQGDPPIPWQVLMPIDYLWFLLLPLNAWFMPTSPPIVLAATVHAAQPPAEKDEVESGLPGAI